VELAVPSGSTVCSSDKSIGGSIDGEADTDGLTEADGLRDELTEGLKLTLGLAEALAIIPLILRSTVPPIGAYELEFEAVIVYVELPEEVPDTASWIDMTSSQSFPCVVPSSDNSPWYWYVTPLVESAKFE